MSHTQHVLRVSIKRLHQDAIIPSYARVGDSGADLCALEDVIIPPGEATVVRTGLAFSLTQGYELQIRPRSGISAKTGLLVVLGTIDSCYRGEVSVIVRNLYPVPQVPLGQRYARCINGTSHATERSHLYGTYLVRKGDRIAQAVIAPVMRAVFAETDELDDTERGVGAFGSTGVHHG